MNYNLSEMSTYIKQNTGFTGGVAVILGSGLGGFTEELNNPQSTDYKDIPNYPVPTVVGHSGEFVIGDYNGVPVIAAKGRFHYYEGHNLETVTLPIALFKSIGVKYLIITNAAGSARKSIPPGTLMLINKYADCTFLDSSDDPKIIKSNSDELLNIVEVSSKKMNIDIEKGTYCWTQGPGYETPAEVKYVQNIGGDAVGMSTVPELIKAEEIGLEAVAISTITNYAAGIIDQPLTHSEVIETADRTKTAFAGLVGTTITEIGKYL